MKKICILGLGWLGQPLADLFRCKGWHVSGSTRTASKQNAFAKSNIPTVMFDLYHDKATCIEPDFFANAVLVLNIPPGRKNFVAEHYQRKMKALIDYGFQSGLKQLIFVSTTAVFGQCKGEITQQTKTAPLSESGKAHQNIEAYIQTHYWQKSAIVRPSGLVGQQRHPAISLSQKTGIKLGLNPINLIHQEDVLRIIETIIHTNTFAHAFNLSSLDHPSRQEYYTWCCKQMGIQLPGFDDDLRSLSEIDGKTVNMKTELQLLGLSLKYPSAFDFPFPANPLAHETKGT
jgi:nucleoside-diphosphate-sugar epimerase